MVSIPIIAKENKIFLFSKKVRIKASGYIFKKVASDIKKKEYKGNRYNEK